MSTPPQGAAGDNRPIRIPLVTDLQNRSEKPTVDARLVNCYAEKVSDRETHVYRRPGLVPWIHPPVGGAAGLGCTNWNGQVYSVFGSTLYQGTTSLGFVDGSSSYSFSPLLGATPSLFLHNNNNYYYYNSSVGLLQITPGSFSTSVPGAVYLDGTMYVMDVNCNIWGSNINAVSAGNWLPGNVIVAQSDPATAIALAKQLVYVVAFKTISVEMFFDNGNATGSPLGAVPGQKLNYGIRHAGSLAELAGVLLWVDQIREGGLTVRIMDQLTAQPCSTPQVEKILQGAESAGYFTGTVLSWTAKIDGHMFYCLTITGLQMTLVFDLTQRLWYQWTSPTGGYIPIVASTFTGATTVCQGQNDGWLYQLSTQVATDNGVIIPADIYTPTFDGGTYRQKVIDKMRFIGDKYPGNVLQVRVSDDDYLTWSTFRNVDLSFNDPFLDTCGTFARRAWHIRSTANVPGRLIQAIEPELEVGDL